MHSREERDPLDHSCRLVVRQQNMDLPGMGRWDRAVERVRRANRMS